MTASRKISMDARCQCPAPSSVERFVEAFGLRKYRPGERARDWLKGKHEPNRGSERGGLRPAGHRQVPSKGRLGNPLRICQAGSDIVCSGAAESVSIRSVPLSVSGDSRPAAPLLLWEPPIRQHERKMPNRLYKARDAPG
jgi:hypothetical protein